MLFSMEFVEANMILCSGKGGEGVPFSSCTCVFHVQMITVGASHVPPAGRFYCFMDPLVSWADIVSATLY